MYMYSTYVFICYKTVLQSVFLSLVAAIYGDKPKCIMVEEILSRHGNSTLTLDEMKEIVKLQQRNKGMHWRFVCIYMYNVRALLKSTLYK